MQNAQSKTPCRSVGLRRIPSASKADSTAAEVPVAAGTHLARTDTPKSRARLLNRRNEGRSLPLELQVDNVPTMPSEAGASLSEVVTQSDGLKERFDELSHETLRKYSSEDDAAPRNDSFFKKPKLCPSVIPPTLDDLCSLRKRVALKEKQFRELKQAEIICRKHNADKLASEIKHWLCACQCALQELLLAVNSQGNNIDMGKLLHELGIPPKLVQFNVDSEEFD